MMNRTLVQSLRRPAPGLRLAAAAFLLAAGAAVASAQQDPTGSWSSETGGHRFSQGASATDGTYLYIVGGDQDDGTQQHPFFFQKFRRYDPATDTWTTLAEFPFPVHGNAAAFAGGRVFSFGGTNLNDTDTNTIRAYSLATESWATVGATLSSARFGLAAATLGDRIYITGGFSGGRSTANDELDTTNDTVTALAGLPAAIMDHTLTAVASRNRVYAIGGSGAGGPVATTYEFAPDLGTWTTRASIQSAGVDQPRVSAASFSLQNRVYIAGGFSGGAVATTWEYDPVADAWAQRADMSVARNLHAGAAIGNRGYVYGGIGPAAGATGEEFTPPVFPEDPPSNRAPVANAGADQTVEATGPSGAVVTLDGSASTDPDGDALNYVWTGPFGSAGGISATVALPLGTSEVTLTVTDPSEASSSDTVIITVTDTSPPAVGSITASPDSLRPPNHTMREVSVSVTASDLGDPAPECEIISVTSNQDEGNESDWEITGALTLNLRAERSGGEERIYTVTVRCTDLSGNISTVTTTVTVPHGSDSDGNDARIQDRRQSRCDQDDVEADDRESRRHRGRRSHGRRRD